MWNTNDRLIVEGTRGERKSFCFPRRSLILCYCGKTIHPSDPAAYQLPSWQSCFIAIGSCIKPSQILGPVLPETLDWLSFRLSYILHTNGYCVSDYLWFELLILNLHAPSLVSYKPWTVLRTYFSSIPAVSVKTYLKGSQRHPNVGRNLACMCEPWGCKGPVWKHMTIKQLNERVRWNILHVLWTPLMALTQRLSSRRLEYLRPPIGI